MSINKNNFSKLSIIKKSLIHIKNIFNVTRNHDMRITISVLVLLLIGTFMIASATNYTPENYTDSFGNLKTTINKQLFFVCLGVFAMIVLSNVFSFKILYKFWSVIVIVTLILNFSCIFFEPIYGVKAWVHIPLGGSAVSFQPAEISKIVVILVMALFFGKLQNKLPSHELRILNKILLSIAVLVFFIIIFQNDFGTAFVILVITTSCFMTSNYSYYAKYRNIILKSILIAIPLILLVLSPLGTKMIASLNITDNYQIDRFISSANPFTNIYGKSYQLVQGLISMGSGGLGGVGFGESVIKYGSFPALDSDFIIAITIEELGFIRGFLPILIANATIVFSLLDYSMKVKNIRYKIIFIGVASYFLVHFILNIGGASTLIPLTGVPLLLVSSGGTSLLASLIGIGICQSLIANIKKGEVE